MTKRLQQLNPYYEKDGVILWWGDCLDVLKQLDDNSIDSIITDPPYGLQFMDKEWDKLWRNKTPKDKEYQDKNKEKLAGRLRDLPDYKVTASAAMQEWHYTWAEKATYLPTVRGWTFTAGSQPRKTQKT